MSFLYPRTIAVHRPAAQSAAGAQSYGGQTLGSETVVVTGIAASIQLKREGKDNPVGLPGDASVPTHQCFIPLGALANGTVRGRDIVIDDLARRYQVIDPYWDSLGYRLSLIALDA